jgi:hypothetical protein
MATLVDEITWLDGQRTNSVWKTCYLLYLHSPEWEEKRQARMGIAGGICEICERAPAEHVHHLSYRRVFAERIDDLRAVCKKCHDELHAKEKRAKDKYSARNQTIDIEQADVL